MSSLTFGPKWVRDLSSGDTGAAAPPNTPPPRKYKLAEFRYGREEMLALVSDDYEMPLGLKEFQDIINERPVPPLAFIPLSDEEERCQMGGVNSVLVLKMTGRGGPGMRSRGGIRGRGRGRGDYSLHRSTSEEPYSSNRNSWSESSGAFHRPVGRGDSVDGTSSARPGYELRNRLPSEGSFSSKPEYWRSNSREAQTPGSEEETWSLTTGNKPWTGKKGSADNNKNWRSGKDGHDQLQRSKSWSRTTNNDKDDGLPEWCIDDSTEDNMPGSFDASGQFRLFKEGEEADDDDGGGEKDVKENDLNDSAFADDEDTFEHCKDDDAPNNDDNVESSNNIETENKEPIENEENKVTEDISLLENKNIEKGTITVQNDTNKPNMNSMEVIVSPDKRGNDSTSNNNKFTKAEMHAEHDEDLEFSLDHITSMVAKLGDESDEDELTQRERSSGHQQPSEHAAQPMDPSILYAKKAEPGKNISTLQDWIYRDPQGEIQGPFSNEEMLEWLNAGYFTMGLLVRRVCDEVFLPLGDVLKLWGRVPFTAKSQPPPITNQLLHHLQQQQYNPQQQQQQMRQALLQKLQIQENQRPQELALPKELSVWGDASTTPASTIGSPWTPMQDNGWNPRKSPQNAVSLQQIEEEQRHLNQMEKERLEREEALVMEQRRKEEMLLEQQLSNEASAQEENTKNGETECNLMQENSKKKNKKKKKNKGNAKEEEEAKKKLEAEQKQREKEELQRKALEALKHQQQLQQQQKLVEQQRLLEDQNKREEEIRKKQQLQQQQMQQIMYHKYQQQQQQQRRQQVTPSSSAAWTHLPPSNSAPSLAEIQRVQERKEAELKEHMKVIHQQELLQRQQKQQQRWNQQQAFSQQSQRGNVKSLLEIQAEEAKKVMQREQIKQQQYRQQQQQQQQNYNSLPWNAAGQPIHSNKSRTNDSNAMFWDDVIGLPSRVNGSERNNHSKKSFNDFQPMNATDTKPNKRDTRDQEIVNRIFQAQTPNSDFVQWVERNIPALKNIFDVQTVTSFLQDIESPHDINDYMTSILGESPEKKLFVREFLDRRAKTKKVPDIGSVDNKSKSFSEEDGFEDVKRNKKKKKMQKLDPTLLGFQCNADPQSLNRDGGLESVANAPTSKSGKK